jgi:tRNA1(Val) A37 N6-methylase TrmN6
MLKGSSINRYFTFSYSQPEEYRFSHDSVFLARRVFELCRPAEISGLNVLDLCAGCGIVGLDFVFHCRSELDVFPLKVDFLEVQEIYQTHFAVNVQSLKTPAPELSFLNKNYNCLQEHDFSNKYNLILCNPPYFFSTHGVLSPSEFKNRCRFFMDSDFENLLLGIKNSLALGGQAYLLMRDLPEHKWNVIREAEKVLQGALDLTVLGDIRGTHFVRLVKI